MEGCLKSCQFSVLASQSQSVSLRMAKPTYRIIIKSPNDKFPCENVDCPQDWMVKDLKAYLSDNYPSHPPVSSQRLIHAGKLLTDNLNISTLFGKVGLHSIIYCYSRMKKYKPYTWSVQVPNVSLEPKILIRFSRLWQINRKFRVMLEWSAE